MLLNPDYVSYQFPTQSLCQIVPKDLNCGCFMFPDADSSLGSSSVPPLNMVAGYSTPTYGEHFNGVHLQS